MMLEDADIVCIFSDTPPTYKELVGIQWGLWYMKPRTLHWWNQFFHMIMVDDPTRFRQMFRMLVSTFQYVCSLVEQDLETKTPLGLDRLPNQKLKVSKQVAIAICRFATGDSLVSIAELFGVGKSTISEVTTRFVKSLNCRSRHHLT